MPPAEATRLQFLLPIPLGCGIGPLSGSGGLRRDSGSRPGEAYLTGLTRETAYRHRVVAANSEGTATEEAHPFATHPPTSVLGVSHLVHAAFAMTTRKESFVPCPPPRGPRSRADWLHHRALARSRRLRSRWTGARPGRLLFGALHRVGTCLAHTRSSGWPQAPIRSDSRSNLRRRAGRRIRSTFPLQVAEPEETSAILLLAGQVAWGVDGPPRAKVFTAVPCSPCLAGLRHRAVPGLRRTSATEATGM
jgi:hypothetical protein